MAERILGTGVGQVSAPARSDGEHKPGDDKRLDAGAEGTVTIARRGIGDAVPFAAASKAWEDCQK